MTEVTCTLCGQFVPKRIQEYVLCGYCQRLEEKKKLENKGGEIMKNELLASGNVVNTEFGMGTVDSESKLEVFVGGESFTRDEIQGVPVTEGWLERLGLKNTTFDDTFENEKIGFNADGRLMFLACTNLEDENIKCEYVHQIQNLIHTLTGVKIEVIL